MKTNLFIPAITTLLLTLCFTFTACERNDPNKDKTQEDLITTIDTILTEEDQLEITETAFACEPETFPAALCLAIADAGKQGFTQSKFPDSDQMESVGHYEKGVQEGFWKFYYTNGELKMEGHYSTGKREGFWKDYFNNGVVKSEGHFIQCEREGWWKFYYDNGRVKAEGYYRNAIKVDNWKFYNESGQVVEEIFFDC